MGDNPDEDWSEKRAEFMRRGLVAVQKRKVSGK